MGMITKFIHSYVSTKYHHKQQIVKLPERVIIPSLCHWQLFKKVTSVCFVPASQNKGGRDLHSRQNGCRTSDSDLLHYGCFKIIFRTVVYCSWRDKLFYLENYRSCEHSRYHCYIIAQEYIWKPIVGFKPANQGKSTGTWRIEPFGMCDRGSSKQRSKRRRGSWNGILSRIVTVLRYTVIQLLLVTIVAGRQARISRIVSLRSQLEKSWYQCIVHLLSALISQGAIYFMQILSCLRTNYHDRKIRHNVRTSWNLFCYC